MHPTDIERFLNKHIDCDMWIAHVKSFITAINNSLICGKKSVIVIECQTFRTHTNPSRNVSVLVSEVNVHFMSLMKPLHCTKCLLLPTKSTNANVYAFQIIYNAEGHVVKWIFVNDGSHVSLEFQEAQSSPHLMFLQTPTGTITSKELKFLVTWVKGSVFENYLLGLSY